MKPQYGSDLTAHTAARDRGDVSKKKDGIFAKPRNGLISLPN